MLIQPPVKLGELASPQTLPPPVAQVGVTGLAADSRQIRSGFLFAALPGTQTHGQVFIPQAIARGAKAVLTQEGQTMPKSARDTPHFAAPDPARLYAAMSARFYRRQPECLAAVTGTNGKSSVAFFLRHIWSREGKKAASIGTLGVAAGEIFCPASLTTPAADTLYRLLALFARRKITHAVMEASSHGLAQHRLDGAQIKAAAFTLLGRDHLDYHRTQAEYLAAKLRLVRDILPPSGALVLHEDAAGADAFIAAARERGQTLWRIGRKSGDIRIAVQQKESNGQHLVVEYRGKTFTIHLPLIGGFQAANALTAAGLALACGSPAESVFAALNDLPPAPGRLELAGYAPAGQPIYVDYAHTPDALAAVLHALKEHYDGQNVSLVFGAGGERDKSKRGEMGAIAHRLAAKCIITDDNPRSENPAAIRAEIRANCPEAEDIGDRAEAIAQMIKNLRPGEIGLIAGKGHEMYQERQGRRLAFSDSEQARQVLHQLAPLWTAREAGQAVKGRAFGDWQASGVSLDSRTLIRGDLFVALKTGQRDGHNFVNHAFAQGAAAACVSVKARREDRPLLLVPDTMEALENLARAARQRANAHICAITGSAGKTTAKNMLAYVLARILAGGRKKIHAARRSYNNQWGVPLSLAQMPADSDIGIFELGMNRAGEIARLAAFVRPHLVLITTIAPAHLAGLGSLEDVARAKAEVFSALAPDGIAILNRDAPFYDLLARAAGARNIIGFGTDERSAARLLEHRQTADGAEVKAALPGGELVWHMHRRDKASALSALAVLAAVEALGENAAAAAEKLAGFDAGAGRGQHIAFKDMLLIDDSYNANPASMRAGLAHLAACPAKRHIAVLGDMAELGETAPDLHKALAEDLRNYGVDKLYVCGALMETLYRACPPALRGAAAKSAEDLAPILRGELRAGDAVLIKGSRAMAMDKLVQKLQEDAA